MSRITEKQHFIARVVVEEVRETEYPGTGLGDDKTTREFLRVETMTLRATTLEGLQAKLSARVALLEAGE